MNELIAIFVTWQFLVLCVGIAALTFLFRATIEYFILNNPKLPGNSKSRFWRDFILVILPILLGFLFPVIGHSFPYPEAINEVYSKFLFGASAGLLSPTLYRVIKSFLWKTAREGSVGGDSVVNVINTSIQATADDATTDPVEPKI